jgi:nucleotide-binding universal stress UspA family protein
MTSSKFQILVPTDFSEQSVSAFFQSNRIAQIYDAEITILHVIADEPQSLNQYSVTSRDELVEKIDKKIKQFVKEELAFSKKIVSCRIEFGEVAACILKIQNQFQFSMIVMGFNDKINESRKQIGSNSMQVINHAPCQVITVKNKQNEGDFKSIILPLDLSKPFSKKINKAIELAKAWKGAVVNIISVLPQSDELRISSATHQLAEIVTEIESNSIICNAEIILMIKGRESMAEIVADYAHRIKSEMVLIITRHEIGIANKIGASAQSIMNRVEIPMCSIVPLVHQN